MPNYGVSNIMPSSGTAATQQQAMTTNWLPVITMGGAQSSPRRGKLYDLLFGSNATPADTEIEWSVVRVTAGLSTTSIGGTPVSSYGAAALSLDIADAAPSATLIVNSTTYSGLTQTTAASPFYVAINQRASYRWVAAPGSELVWPATSCSGFSMLARSNGTPTVTANALFQE